MIRRVSAGLVLMCTISLHAEGRRRAVAFPSPFPPCSMITGSAAVTFTRDHGATLTPTAERLAGIQAIVFSPGRPNLMYLGLEVESGVR